LLFHLSVKMTLYKYLIYFLLFTATIEWYCRMFGIETSPTHIIVVFATHTSQMFYAFGNYLASLVELLKYVDYLQEQFDYLRSNIMPFIGGLMDQLNVLLRNMIINIYEYSPLKDMVHLMFTLITSLNLIVWSFISGINYYFT